MTKHKKFLKSEKAKVKLKGAKLPKGLNVTKTDFKVKKIVIKEQIKGTFQADGTVIRHENIKELLSKLQHHNSTYRNEGLHYLKEILAHQPEEVNRQLGTIIKGIAPLCLDIEHDVRKECFKAFNILLSTISLETLIPFFDILTSYLKCAMTHITMSIQEDSLFLLDAMLLHAPSLVAANSDTIFSCFLDMISKLRIESKPGRTLSVNLGSKITSVKWRTKVLDRLLGMLKAMVQSKIMEKNVQFSGLERKQATDIIPLEQDSMNGNSKIIDTSKPMPYSLTRSHLNQNCKLPLLFHKRSSGISSTLNASSHDESGRIKQYTELLMPLIFETWMEAQPNQSSSAFDDQSIVSTDTAHLLKTLLEIVENIYNLNCYCDEDMNTTELRDWFSSTFRIQFYTNFLLSFPYSQNKGNMGSGEKKSKNKSLREFQDAGGQHCFYQNLMISHLFSCLNKTLNRTNQLIAEKIIKFVKGNITNESLTTQQVIFVFTKVLNNLLLDNVTSWHKSKESIQELLHTMVRQYQQNKIPKEMRSKVLTILCNIVLNWNTSKIYSQNILEQWLQKLPDLLNGSHISVHVLKTFSTLAKQRNAVFLNAFKDNISNILSNLQHIQVTGVENDFEGKRLIINLFYWLDDTSVIESILPSITDAKIQSAIVEIVRLKTVII